MPKIAQSGNPEQPFIGRRSSVYTWPLAIDFNRRPRELTPDQATQLIDFISTDRGLRIRDAFVQLGSNDLGVATGDDEPILLAEYEREADDSFICAHTPTKFWVLASGTWDDKTHAAGDYTGGSSTPWASDVVLDTYVFTNSLDKIQVWNGTASDALDIAAAGSGLSLENVRAKYLLGFAGRLILLNTIETAVPHALRARWSVEGQFQADADWTDLGSGAADLAESPDVITGAARLANIAVIYKERSIIHCIETGDVNAPLAFEWKTMAKIGSGQGLVSNFTLANLRSRHIGLFSDNVYIYDGLRLQPVGDAVIRNVIENAGFENINQSFATVLPTESHYILWVPSGGQAFPEQAYVYDYRRDLWVGTLQKRASSATVVTSSATTTWDNYPNDPDWDEAGEVTWDSTGQEVGLPQLIIGDPAADSEARTVRITDKTAAPALTADAIWQTGDLDFGFSDRRTTVRRVRLRVDTSGIAATIEASISNDTGTSFPTGASADALAIAGEQDLFFDMIVTAERHMFRFMTTVSLTILEWEVYYNVGSLHR